MCAYSNHESYLFIRIVKNKYSVSVFKTCYKQTLEGKKKRKERAFEAWATDSFDDLHAEFPVPLCFGINKDKLLHYSEVIIPEVNNFITQSSL